jgi:hypothetical protein
VAIRMIFTALPITSAGRFWPSGPAGIEIPLFLVQLRFKPIDHVAKHFDLGVVDSAVGLTDKLNCGLDGCDCLAC